MENTNTSEATLLDKIKTQMADVKTELGKDIATNKSATEVKQAEAETKIATLVNEMNNLGVEVKAMKEKGMELKADNTPMTLRKALEVAFAEKKNEIDEIVKNGQKSALRIELKADVISTESVTLPITLTENTGIISTIRKRELTYLANVSVGSISTSRALWIEEQDEDGVPIFIGEGDGKIQLDVKYVEQTKSVKKIAVYSKVTSELMADLPQLISFIESNLMKRMDIAVEEQLFNGNDGGDNLAGVIGYATGFAAGQLAGTIPSANHYDVIEAMINQVNLGFGNANVIYVHPTDYAKMLLLKDEAGNYIVPRWASADGLVVNGVKVISTTSVAEGTFVGGDFSVVHVLNRSAMGIQIGLDGNDFTNNVKTILLEKRLVQFVSANDTQVLVKGVFITAITALSV